MSSGADSEGWEQRMSDRAKAREEQRAREDPIQRREAYERLNPDLAWLNGYRRLDLRHVWRIGWSSCIGCGSVTGMAAYVLDPDVVYPPEPAWPFTPDACPVCLGGESLLRVDLGPSSGYPKTELREPPPEYWRAGDVGTYYGTLGEPPQG